MSVPNGKSITSIMDPKTPVHVALVLIIMGGGWYALEALKTFQQSWLQSTNDLNKSIATSMEMASQAAERQAQALESIALSAKLEHQDDNALIRILELMEKNQGC